MERMIPMKRTLGTKFMSFLLAFVMTFSVPALGQTADFLPMTTLLRIGVSNEEVDEAVFPLVDEMFAGQEEDSISIYSGINRAIFRKGVALTSEALRQKSLGQDPYVDAYDMYNVRKEEKGSRTRRGVREHNKLKPPV